MATNPKYPRPDERPQPKLVEVGKPGRFPWPLIALIVAGAILLAIMFALPRTPRATPGPAAGQVPDQPFATQFQLTSLRVADSPVGGQAYVYGEIKNTGSNPVNQITIDASFMDSQGKPLQRETRNMELLSTKASIPEVVKDPLKPGATVPFRVPFDTIPSGWNHEVPQMQIVHVASQGQSGIPEK